jgi:hypothetical protein
VNRTGEKEPQKQAALMAGLSFAAVSPILAGRIGKG